MTHSMAQMIHEHVRGQREAMVDLLSALVSAESPSSVPEAQAGPQALLVDQFNQLGYHITLTPGETTGGTLLAEAPGAAVNGRQLLLGHCDTVWPIGTLAHRPLVIEDGMLRGPGSYDMKAGLVQGIFALRALRDLGLKPLLAPVFLVNSDEEIGSFESRDAIEREARQAARALILEPASGPNGKLKTARKGVGGFEIVVGGKAAHAGLEPEKGVSAILGMAQIIPELFAMSDLSRGLTVNVGVIRGGLQSNVIAPECRVEVDVRITSMADAADVETKIRALAPTLPGTTITVTGGFDRPPLEPTPANRDAVANGRASGRRVRLGAGGMRRGRWLRRQLHQHLYGHPGRSGPGGRRGARAARTHRPGGHDRSLRPAGQAVDGTGRVGAGPCTCPLCFIRPICVIRVPF